MHFLYNFIEDLSILRQTMLIEAANRAESEELERVMLGSDSSDAFTERFSYNGKVLLDIVYEDGNVTFYEKNIQDKNPEP